MKKISIEERAISLARYIVETKDTVRSTAKKFGISKSTVQIVILDGETEISDNEILSLEKGATKVLNVGVQSVATNGQALPYYILVDGKYHKILEDEKGNLSLEETVTPESTVKGTTDHSATYALNLASSDTESENATVTLNDGKITIVGNEKTTEDITVTIKYANTENVEDVKATKRIKIKITKSVINYGTGKTAETVVQGDTISITFGSGDSAYTEDFMVLQIYDSEKKIMAIPYYNITQSTTDPRQASSGTGTLAFSGSNFWNAQKVNIEPMSSSNIQQFISAYSTKLYNVTNHKVTAEPGRYYGNYALSVFDNQSNSESKKLLNPSGIGFYWLASSYEYVDSLLLNVKSSGSIYNERYGNSSEFGVRPVIFIDISQQ